MCKVNGIIYWPYCAAIQLLVEMSGHPFMSLEKRVSMFPPSKQYMFTNQTSIALIKANCNCHTKEITPPQLAVEYTCTHCETQHTCVKDLFKWQCQIVIIYNTVHTSTIGNAWMSHFPCGALLYTEFNGQ